MTDEAVPPNVPTEHNPDKWRLGCGLGCLGLIVIWILATVSATWFTRSLIADMEDELAALGLEQQSGKIMKVEDKTTTPTYYKAQMVQVNNGSDVAVGFICQSALLQGEFHGPVTFRGQILTIHEDAVLHQGLDVKAQMIEKLGEVKGDITGEFFNMTDRSYFDYSKYEDMFD